MPGLFKNKKLKQEIFEIVEDIKASLEWYKGLGIKSVDISKESSEILSIWSNGKKRQSVQKSMHSPCGQRGGVVSPCSQFRKERKKTDLFKDLFHFQGPENAGMVLLLDMPELILPGKKMDAYNGAAGELLLKILNAMELGKDTVRTCFFPEMKDDVKAMRRFYRNMDMLGNRFKECILLSPPLLICTMGNPALQLLLGRQHNIKNVRGEFHDYHGIPLMPTLHPAQLLVEPLLKRDVWSDMKKIMERMGL